MANIYNYSTTEIIRLLGTRLRAYRIRLGLTQKELSERAGVSVPTLQSFESGQSQDLSFSTLLRLLRGIGQLDGVGNLLADSPDSPYMLQDNGKQIKRVRHKV